MKVSRARWELATINLIARRLANGHNDDNRSNPNPVRDYASHLIRCGFGNSVLDVGCGSQHLKTCLPNDVEYIGMDAFPVDGTDTIRMAVEDMEGIEVDTVVAFAVLDNCMDFFQACDRMKAAARQNVMILTGMNIEVDQYHTFNLQREHFKLAFHDWHCSVEHQIIPKVWLLNFQRLA
jgi:hypothetical protein